MAGNSNRQLRQILIAVDLSPTSERVVRRATLLPIAEDAKLEIFHVLKRGMPARAHAAAEKNAQQRLARLRQVAESAAGPSSSVAVKTVAGVPYVEIIRRSRALTADLVVVGGEGRQRLGDRLLIGSTPRRIIRKGDVPVLVVTLDSVEPYRRTVVAVDLSDSARRVVALARRILWPNGQPRVTLVHAYQVPFEGWMRESGLGQEYKAAAASQLEKFHNSLGDEGRRWRTVLRKGDPRLVVLTEAERRKAELVVLGTHGRSGVSHALLGSVAEWLTSEARCDVAITRPARYSFEMP